MRSLLCMHACMYVCMYVCILCYVLVMYMIRVACIMAAYNHFYLELCIGGDRDALKPAGSDRLGYLHGQVQPLDMHCKEQSIVRVP